MSDNKPPILKMVSISKKFPGVNALEKVDFDLYPGEVHVLVGENGAGKSTLMKVLTGAYTLDSGSIVIDEHEFTSWSPTMAQEKGVAMVYQEFTLLPFRNVAENIFLGHELIKHKILLDKPKMHEEAAKLLKSIGITVDTNAMMNELGVADQQMVEIAKALTKNARILVLDEPTSALSMREIEQLFKTIRMLKSNGVGIIYISHRLEEMKLIGDRVSVMRDGHHIGTRQVSETSLDELIKMMIGREIKELYPRNLCQAGEVALRTDHMTSGNKIHDVNLELRYGEIVGLAGLVGAGRTETARAIFGLDPITSGHVEMLGRRFTRITPPAMVDFGMGLVPEDRRKDGLFPSLSLRQNIVMASLRKLFKSGLIALGLEKQTAQTYVEQFNIQPPGLERAVQFLSGGNQQKVVLGKWLAAEPKIIIIDEPTRGIDVGAKSEVHALMDKLANSGCAILMISSELPEVLGMSDRIYVMHDGTIAGEFKRGVTSEEILRCAMGFA